MSETGKEKNIKWRKRKAHCHRASSHYEAGNYYNTLNAVFILKPQSHNLPIINLNFSYCLLQFYIWKQGWNWKYTTQSIYIFYFKHHIHWYSLRKCTILWILYIEGVGVCLLVDWWGFCLLFQALLCIFLATPYKFCYTE